MLEELLKSVFFFFSSRRRHTRLQGDWSSDVCSSDLREIPVKRAPEPLQEQVPGGVRINKRLADMGLCSRREADEWVDKGWVRVNGELAVMGQNVVAADRITVEREARERQDQQVTILIHKPMGYVKIGRAHV